MQEPQRVRIDDQLCFALYAGANAVVRAYRPLLAEIGLTYPQYLAMMALWEDDDSSVTQVADRLQLPGNAVTPLLARLEHLGYLTRRRDERDGRVVRARLTALGADLERQAAEVQRRVVCRTGLDGLSLAALRKTLQDLVEGMGTTAACDTSAPATEGEAS